MHIAIIKAKISLYGTLTKLLLMVIAYVGVQLYGWMILSKCTQQPLVWIPIQL